MVLPLTSARCLNKAEVADGSAIVKRMHRALKVLLFILLAPPVLWLVIIVFNIRLPLSMFNQPLSAAFSQALGRNMNFTGELFLAPTLQPALEISEVSIDNPVGFDGQLLRLGRVYLQLDLLSLLSRKLVIEEFQARKVFLDLQVAGDGRENWPLDPSQESAASDESRKDEEQDLSAVTEILQLRFEHIQVSYRDLARNSQLLFALDHLDGRMRWEEDIQLNGNGTYQNQPWQLAISGGSIKGLLQGEPGWQVESIARLPGLDVHWQTNLTAQGRETQLKISGENLATLSPMAEVALPPWGPYELSGFLVHTENALALHDFKLRVGDSNMRGTLDLQVVDEVPRIKVELISELIQVNDFLLQTQAETEPLETAAEELRETAETNSEPFDAEAVLSPDVLDRLRLDISLAFDEILSGEDRLGSGSLRARAGGDRVSLDEWHINLPAGDIDLSAEVVVADPGFHVALNLDIENFDYGVMARRQDPDTDLQGQFYFKLDLQAQTPHLDQALAFGNGSLDFAVWPEEFKSGVFDVWAVGLISAAINEFESDSVINCLVARFELKDGIMRERALMIDTSEMRVLGDAVINFPDETVDIVLTPHAKKPQFVSAATPVAMKGSFDAFEPNIKNSDIAFSVVRSGLNIALWGIPLLFHKTLAADGSDECRRAMTEDVQLERKNR
jgi:uncharacterized protein involved in outer membrane biogenesis